ncbi:MAG: dihydrofolate reductase family protein [Candidatus Kapabacteria bacterium]|nr:dihydrofolate reductase family protein [Candidatus Kapabacteria bacterium]
MQKLVVRCFTISLDGYSASTNQTLEQPFGENGIRLMNWAFATKHFSKMFGKSSGEEGIDNDLAAAADENIGATIMGRHMFGADRGPFDMSWKGWWGDNPPYHHQVFVLSHHRRESFALEGNNSFTFINDGIESALEKAFTAANGKDVRIGGGADTVRQYLKAGLIDELHLVQVPILFGQGERIFEGLGGIEDQYECKKFIPSNSVSHIIIGRK